MTAPTTWDEAVERVLDGFNTRSVGGAGCFDGDMENLRRIYEGTSRQGASKPAWYAASMAGAALGLLDLRQWSWRQHILALMVSKQRDYGQGSILAFGEKGLIVRLSDKVERYKNLKRRGEANNESLEDTLIDIVGYAILLRMLEEGWFTLPLAEDVKKPAPAATWGGHLTVTVPPLTQKAVEDIVRAELLKFLAAWWPTTPSSRPPWAAPAASPSWQRYVASWSA